ncbi:MAG: flagellar filament outer layer protein FlaA [Spirochaetaceae bacterium]|jgi:hypothetical protein|nr:flagellar filament outer layer protein FlaA [Spirochaetaceae bacterium]
MKQGGLIGVCLVLVFVLFCMPVFGQNKGTVSYESLTIDNFDTPDDMNWTWYAYGSRFVSEGFPKLQYFDGMPNSLRAVQSDPDKTYRVLGMRTRFDRKGDNWIEIIPVQKGTNEVTPYEIPLIGRIQQIDIWVWGAKYRYHLEMLIRDSDGRVHTLNFGPVDHEGWKNLSVKIPTYIRQQSRLLSGPQNMTLVGLRIRTDPREYVDDFLIYFDQMKVLTDTFTNVYDGFEFSAFEFEDTTQGAGQ